MIGKNVTKKTFKTNGNALTNKSVALKKGATKAAKKEVKAEEVKEENVDYSKMTVAELKEVAKSKKIDTTGMKKADIVAALNK